mmetsp:Transcript_10812/g.25907  ORF Transcript_10812/g.25907 Transcript_10812/m.25907 type:complete len:823 (-) Transcript_10812:1843-4311(-)
MIIPKATLGDISTNSNCKFLQGKGAPGIIIIPKKNSFSLWSIRTLSLVAILGGKSKVAKNLKVSKISRLKESKKVSVILGFDCGIIQLWILNLNQVTASCIQFKGHQQEICAIGQGKEEDIFVSGCQKGDIVEWNILKKKGSFRITFAHKSEIVSIKLIEFFQNKKSAILSCGKDILVKFWDLKSGKCLRTFGFTFQSISSLDFHNKSRTLLISNENRKVPIFCISQHLDLYKIGEIWRVSTSRKQFLKIYKLTPVVFLFDKKGNIEITFLVSKKFSFKGQNGNEIKPVEIFSEFKYPVFFSLKKEIQGLDVWQNGINRKILILVHFSRTNFLEILEFSFSKGQRKKSKYTLIKIFREKLDSHQGEIRSLLWLSNDNFIVSLGGTSKTIQTWHWNTQKCTSIIETYSKGLCFGLCGPNTVVIGGKDGSIELYDLISSTLVWSKTGAHSGPIWTLDTIDNYLLMSTGGSDGILKIWEFESNTISLNKQLLIKDQILGIKLVPTRNLIIVCGISSTISVFFLGTLQFSFSLLGHSLPVITIGLCDNLELIGTGSADFSIKIWNLNQKKEVKTLIADNSAITAFDFQKYSNNFFSGSKNGKIKYWNGSDFFLICEISNFHSGPVWVLKSSENGKFLASGSQDKALVVWEVKKKNEDEIIFFKKIQKTGKKIGIGSNFPIWRRKKSRLQDHYNKTLEIITKKRKTMNNYQQVLSGYSFLDEFFYHFSYLSEEEISNLIKFLKKKDLIFFLDKILVNSIQQFAVDPLSIFDQLFLIIKRSFNVKENQKKNNELENFRKKVKRIFKHKTIQVGIILEGLRKLKKMFDN